VYSMMSREVKNQVPTAQKPLGSQGKRSTPRYILLRLSRPVVSFHVGAKPPGHFAAVTFFTSWIIVSSGGLSCASLPTCM
jgi:hypothetical protein